MLHVAGSKGKGSTALFAERLLGALGHSTFTFTSPHLERWTERLRLDGREVDAATALETLETVRAAAERRGIVPGFFEALTVAGLWLAARARVDWAVIECGVGGRADATNVVRPAVTVITGIEREHVDRLGSELSAIAREKAGIVKPGAPLVAPALPAPIDAVLAAAANTARVPHLRARQRRAAPAAAGGPDELGWHYADGRLTACGPGWRVRTALASPGRQAAGNAVLALAALGSAGLASAEHLQRAARVLAREGLPGRTEVISRLPWIMIDSAHTGASAQALAETVGELRAPCVHLLLSCSGGKDVDALLAPLLPLVSRVTTTRADPDYSLDAETLAHHVRRHRPDLPVRAITDTEDALAQAAADRPGESLVLATGSVYLAGAVRRALHGSGAGPSRA